MKTLSKLLERIDYECLAGTVDTQVGAVVYDSRKVTPGCLFICIAGANADGHDFAAEAVKKGAKVLVVGKDIVKEGILSSAKDVTPGIGIDLDKTLEGGTGRREAGNAAIREDTAAKEDAAVKEGTAIEETAAAAGAETEVTVIKVADTRYAMAFIAAEWFDNPASEMKTIGITGTKGKTTTTYMVRSILEHAGHKVGLIGTIEVIIGEKRIHAVNTTPESYLLQEYLRQMADAGCDAVVMEVSSQGLMLHRSQGFIFDYGIFTNIEPDHIGPNEHADFEEYLACKGLLFRQCRVGIVNRDDPHWEQVAAGHTCELETYGFSPDADLRAGQLELIKKPGELGVFFHVKGQMDLPVEVTTPGRFSVYNALTAIAICRHFKVEEAVIQKAFLEAKVKGRIEMVKVSDTFTLMIDYAHNAMSLESLLSTLREYEPNRLVCLFGCGGNRSKLRRYEMGEVSGKLADLTIITSDNPRFEEPQDIIEDIKAGIGKTEGKYVEICDRKEAIAYAIEHGEPGDIIVLAGKGHEDYQEIKGVKYPMDERNLIRDILKERGWKENMQTS